MNEQWLEHLPLKDIKEISPVSGGDERSISSRNEYGYIFLLVPTWT